jgi:hypothetical protein
LAGDGGGHTDRLSAGPLVWSAAGGAVVAGGGQRLPDHWRVPEPKNHSAMSKSIAGGYLFVFIF